MHLKKKWIFAACILLISAAKASAQPASQERIQLASATPAARFISLQEIRASRAATSGLRSDHRAMQQGFMRLDRNMVVVSARLPRSNVVVTRPQSASASASVPASSAPASARIAGHAWPVAKHASQYISSGYGMRTDPFHGKQRFHGGIDIAVDAGTPVLASADGLVTAVGPNGGLGRHVSIQHASGEVSMYGHLSREDVRVGQRVRQGQQVGLVGSTGRSTGAHLDYRIKQQGRTVDPLRVLAHAAMPVFSKSLPKGQAVTIARVAQLDGSGARRLPQRPMVIQVR